MKKKIIIIVFIVVALLIGVTYYCINKYQSRGIAICSKTILTEEYHKVDLQLTINTYEDGISYYEVKTIYSIYDDDKFEELSELLEDCNRNYINNKTIECDVEEKEVVRNYTLKRKYKEYIEDLQGQGFTCDLKYTGFEKEK